MTIDEKEVENLDEALIQKTGFCAPGTFWVIKEPAHGDFVNGITSIDPEGNKNFSVCGEVYCANCDSWTEHRNTKKAKSCPECNAPYAAKSWFPENLYNIEINGEICGKAKPYQEAVGFAQTQRLINNVIIVSVSRKSRTNLQR